MLSYRCTLIVGESHVLMNWPCHRSGARLCPSTVVSEPHLLERWFRPLSWSIFHWGATKFQRAFWDGEYSF